MTWIYSITFTLLFKKINKLF